MDADLIRERLDIAVSQAMDEACDRAMRWEEDNCAFWVAGPLAKVFGYDAVAPWRGTVRSRETADQAIGQVGLGHRLRAAAKQWGWKHIPPESAEVGDVGLTVLVGRDGTRRPTVTICRANTAGKGPLFLARSEMGFSVLPHEIIRLCWAVV